MAVGGLGRGGADAAGDRLSPLDAVTARLPASRLSKHVQQAATVMDAFRWAVDAVVGVVVVLGQW